MNIHIADALANKQNLIDSLMYRNYVFNRENRPDISPERWEIVFGKKAREYEALYQMEVK